MAKAASKSKQKATEPTEIVVEYDLSALPTAFHKAGLAGLILLVKFLQEEQKLGDDIVTFDATSARFVFRRSELITVMDDVYDADIQQVKVKSKWPGATLLGEEMLAEEREGKIIQVKHFVYEQVVPRGRFFERYFDGNKAIWLKLWRDMIWNIPRGRPTTRIPYNNRAEGHKKNNTTSSGEGEAAWSELLKVEKAKNKNTFFTQPLSSALLPAAQAVNAEGIAFDGRAEQNLLLHFWPLVVLIYVPVEIDVDGSSEFSGYSLAVPDIADLQEFIDQFPIVLNNLSDKKQGYRPRDAVVDVAAEGGLAFFERLASVVGADLEEGQTSFTAALNAVEYLHLLKQGNNIKQAASGRIAPDRSMFWAYRRLIDPKQPPYFRHPLFRRALLLAILDRDAWYRPFAQIFPKFDAEVFVRNYHRDVDDKRPQFAIDARLKFNTVTEKFNASRESFAMTNSGSPPASLPDVVNRLVKTYVRERAEKKANINLEKFKNAEGKTEWEKLPEDFKKARHDLALGLMLEFRSRKDQAFINHFAATFFSVTQRLNEQDRTVLAQTLAPQSPDDDREQLQTDLKTLTLLALSANS